MQKFNLFCIMKYLDGYVGSCIFIEELEENEYEGCVGRRSDD